MRIRIYASHEEACRHAADAVRSLVRSRPRAVLGLATGSSPLPLYRELVRMRAEEGVDFTRITTFNLDEYIGLGPEDPASYHVFMRLNLFDGLGIPARSTHLPSGVAGDYLRHCAEYERLITRSGGIDLQILGIGADGHIGFNEPGTSLASLTNVQTLSPQTIRDNARFFATEADVPRHAVTMGVATILRARRILVLAGGSSKADAVARAIEGPVSASLPASALQMHRDTTWYLDRAAASGLKQSDYYAWIQSVEGADPDGPASVVPR